MGAQITVFKDTIDMDSATKTHARPGDAGWRVAVPFFLTGLTLSGLGVVETAAQLSIRSGLAQQQSWFKRQTSLVLIGQLSTTLGVIVFSAGLLVLVLRQHERWRQGRFPRIAAEYCFAHDASTTVTQTAPAPPYAQNNWTSDPRER